MRALVLIGLFCGAGCQQLSPGEVRLPADSAAGEVALRLAGPSGAALVVPVLINGEGPFDFVLDTGATITCVDQALADSLGLEPLSGAVGIGAGATQTGRLRLVEIDSLQVGAAAATGLPGCTLDLSHVQELGFDAAGLLGLNFLRSFRVTIDFDRSVVILQDPGAAE